jgi:hypothetical protein
MASSSFKSDMKPYSEEKYAPPVEKVQPRFHSVEA